MLIEEKSPDGLERLLVKLEKELPFSVTEYVRVSNFILFLVDQLNKLLAIESCFDTNQSAVNGSELKRLLSSEFKDWIRRMNQGSINTQEAPRLLEAKLKAATSRAAQDPLIHAIADKHEKIAEIIAQCAVVEAFIKKNGLTFDADTQKRLVACTKKELSNASIIPCCLLDGFTLDNLDSLLRAMLENKLETTPKGAKIFELLPFIEEKILLKIFTDKEISEESDETTLNSKIANLFSRELREWRDSHS